MSSDKQAWVDDVARQLVREYGVSFSTDLQLMGEVERERGVAPRAFVRYVADRFGLRPFKDPRQRNLL